MEKCKHWPTLALLTAITKLCMPSLSEPLISMDSSRHVSFLFVFYDFFCVLNLQFQYISSSSNHEIAVALQVPFRRISMFTMDASARHWQTSLSQISEDAQSLTKSYSTVSSHILPERIRECQHVAQRFCLSNSICICIHSKTRAICLCIESRWHHLIELGQERLVCNPHHKMWCMCSPLRKERRGVGGRGMHSKGGGGTTQGNIWATKWLWGCWLGFLHCYREM